MIKHKIVLVSACLLALALTALSAPPPPPPPPDGQWIFVTSTNPLPVSVGDTATAQDYFMLGLEYGSALAAILLGFISVRRALSMGDAWND